MKYKLQAYISTIWQELRKGARIWHIRQIIRKMHQELAKKNELLEKIELFIHPDQDQYKLSLGLNTLKLNNKWLFNGIRTPFKRGWLLKLRKLEKLSRKNRILLLENYLLLGKDIFKIRDLKLLDQQGLTMLINEIDQEIIERYFLDKKKRVRARMQQYLLASTGPFLTRSLRGTKARARTPWQKLFFNRKINKGLSVIQVNKEIKLSLMSAVFKDKIPDLLTEKDYLHDESDPLIKYLYTAMIYNDPKRKKNFPEDAYADYELIQNMRKKAGG